jgi:hypothetical protein
MDHGKGGFFDTMECFCDTFHCVEEIVFVVVHGLRVGAGKYALEGRPGMSWALGAFRCDVSKQ